ncbi:ABC transporter permease [Streptococcus dentiloxodontae]
MKRYILGRILRSLISIFMVTTLVYVIVFTMIPKTYIFQQDAAYSKNTSTPDKKVDYESTILNKMGYIDYWDSKDLLAKAQKKDSSITSATSASNKSKLQTYLDGLSGNWRLGEFEEGGYYAIRDIPVYERVWNFYVHLIDIDHPWKVQDKSNPNLKRYLKIVNDKSVGWSLVGSGTEHKYLIYFNASFPYIHQNIVTFDLGVSYPTYANNKVLDVISDRQGLTKMLQVTFPSGLTKMSSVDIDSRTYQSPSTANAQVKSLYGSDPYTKTETIHKDPSMITSSAIAGLIGVVIAYAVGLPLAMFMARYKNKLFDNVSTVMLTFLMALPSIALVYILRYIGSSFLGFPILFTQYGAQDWRSYTLPALSLGVMSIPGVAIWMRRYLIDQESSDYVRFARAKGLSEAEVARKHVFKNAMVPIVSGIPGAIIGVIGGATLTESIFAFPGMGKILIDSVKAANSAMIVGIVFIFTVVSIISMLLGDILMTIVDPRIKLSGKGGK